VKADRAISERAGSLAATYSDGGFPTEDRRAIVTVIDDIQSRLLGRTSGVILLDPRSGHESRDPGLI
jgi:hypothetical protein